MRKIFKKNRNLTDTEITAKPTEDNDVYGKLLKNEIRNNVR